MISEYTYSSKVWLFPYERVMPGEEVIVYGAGYVGSRLVQQIEKNNYCKIRYLTDKNWSRLGALKWGGIEIKSPEEILNCDCKVIIAIENESIKKEVICELIKLGVDVKRIVSGLYAIPYVGSEEIKNPISTIIHYSEEEIKGHSFEKDYMELSELLRVYECTSPFIRVGNNNDGGYVMADCFFNYGEAYSFGISDDCSWDLTMAEKGYDVFMYDHTIEGIIYDDDRLHFNKIGIAEEFDHSDEVDTLENIIYRNGHVNKNGMVLKMDVEGAEYGFMKMVSDSTLNQFDQIVLELHNLHSRPRDAIDLLHRIDKLFGLIHIHVNNYASVIMIDSRIIPDVLELSFLNKHNDSILPKRIKNRYLNIDAPNCPDISDFVI